MFCTQVKQPISSLRVSQGASTDAGSGGGSANSFTWHQCWYREGPKGIDRSARERPSSRTPSGSRPTVSLAHLEGNISQPLS